jgi:hypothetical protein
VYRKCRDKPAEKKAAMRDLRNMQDFTGDVFPTLSWIFSKIIY